MDDVVVPEERGVSEEGRVTKERVLEVGGVIKEGVLERGGVIDDSVPLERTRIDSGRESEATAVLRFDRVADRTRKKEFT